MDWQAIHKTISEATRSPQLVLSALWNLLTFGILVDSIDRVAFPVSAGLWLLVVSLALAGLWSFRRWTLSEHESTLDLQQRRIAWGLQSLASLWLAGSILLLIEPRILTFITIAGLLALEQLAFWQWKELLLLEPKIARSFNDQPAAPQPILQQASDHQSTAHPPVSSPSTAWTDIDPVEYHLAQAAQLNEPLDEDEIEQQGDCQEHEIDSRLEERPSREILDFRQPNGTGHIEGNAICSFRKGEKVVQIQVPFVPAFAATPHIEAEADDETISVQVTQRLPIGFRLELKRRDASTELTSEIHWEARRTA